MIFIDQRINHDHGRADQEPTATNSRCWGISKGSRGQESENRIFGKVCQLSRDYMDDGKRFRSGVRKQPAD